MKFRTTFFFFFFALGVTAQPDSFYLLKPDAVFDGEQMHAGWTVLVKGETIEAVGEAKFKLPANTRIINLAGSTILPGLIEGHAHLFLHPYNEVSWNEQVLNESRAERTARAVNHARATLMAGFTTVRDLGTEGAMYDDAGLKQAIAKGVIPGPRMIIATRAIVAKGSYAPKNSNADVTFPQGAEEVSGSDEIAKTIRVQMNKGADVIKIYADYSYGMNGETAPAFSKKEWETIMEVATLGGRKVVAHASGVEGMRMATLAGVSTIEHGNEGSEEIFKLMKEKGVALCATLAAGEAVLQYGGWKKNSGAEPDKIAAKKRSFAAALKQNVTICFGGDVGVFTHGDNAREMELMVEYGMKPLDVLRSATSVNAEVFGYANQLGRIKKGMFADIIAVRGNPSTNIGAVRNVVFVMKAGKIYKQS